MKLFNAKLLKLTSQSKSLHGCNSLTWTPGWANCCMVKHNNCTEASDKSNSGSWMYKGIISAFHNKLPPKPKLEIVKKPTTLAPYGLTTDLTSTSNPTTTIATTTEFTTVFKTTTKSIQTVKTTAEITTKSEAPLTKAKTEPTTNSDIITAIDTKAIVAQLINRYMRQLTNFDKLLDQKIKTLNRTSTVTTRRKPSSNFDFLTEEILELAFRSLRQIERLNITKSTLKIIALITLTSFCTTIVPIVFRIYKSQIKVFELVKALKKKRKPKMEINRIDEQSVSIIDCTRL